MVSVDQTVELAAFVIEHTREKVAVVIDSKGILRGLVTQADLNAKRLQGSGMKMPIEKIMNPYPKSFSVEESDDVILDYMVQSNIRQLPLVDENGAVCDIRYIDENDIVWVTKTDSTKTTILKDFHWKSMEYSRVVFLGDGLTDFCEWTEFIHIPRTILCNRGIFGNTINEVRNRLNSVFLLHPSKIFLMVGINDFVRGHSLDCIFEEYLALALELQKGSERDGTSIFLQSILPVQHHSLIGLDSKKIREFNEMVHTWAKHHHITYIDVYSSLVTGDEVPAEYTVDGWHLNAEGYKLWISCLKNYL